MPEFDGHGWKLRLLGDFALLRGGAEVRRLRAQKYAHLLAYLALSPDRAFSRETLVDVFWPDEPIDNARTCLRTALSSLRRQLDDPELFLEGSKETVRLRSGAVTTDVAQFEQAVRDRVSDAAELYGGPFLPGCYYDWAFEERERLEQLFHTLPSRKGPERGPKAAGMAGTTFRVPVPISAFHGRASELAELQGLLGAGRRLVTLVGLGGIGKTRLALELGRMLSGRVAFVELAELRTADELPVAVVEAVRLGRHGDESVQVQLEQELATEPTVLILDNFEQLVEVGGPEWVDALLRSVDTLSVLATSRISLGLEGETIYRVPPLSEADSIQLFIDRARSAMPDFSKSEVLPELCQRLDRIPLAIELCASWASVLSSRRMLEALADRFELMRSRKRNVPERQQSLMAVLEWTVPEGDELRPAFARLGVMRGTWSLDAAEAVIGDEASEVLDRLLERALLQRAADDDGPRFSMLETVREYAFEQLDPVELAGAQQRHHRYYCRLAVALGNEHGREPRRGFERLEREHANIVAAFQYGVTATGEPFEATVYALELLRWIWWVRGYEPQFRSLISQVADRDDTDLTGGLRAMVLRAKARRAAYEGRFSEAIGLLDQAYRIWTDLGEIGSAAETLKSSAMYKVDMGDVGAAIADLRKGLDLLEVGTEGYYIMMAELAGVLFRETDELDEVERLYQQMVSHWESQPLKKGHWAVLTNALAECSVRRGRYEKAEAQFREAARAFAERGELIKEVHSVESLAACLDAMGRREEADQTRSLAAERRKRLGAGA